MEKELQKVSVIIPSHNRAHCITKSIQSVLKQTYPVHEVIIADDCSTDNTEEVVTQIGDARVKYYRLPANKGAGGARNYGVTKAESEWIAFHDSDDEWTKDKLEKQMAYLEKNPQVGLVYSAYKMHLLMNIEHVVPPMEDLSILEGDIYKNLLIRNSVGAPTVVMKKDIFWEVEGFDESMRSLEDWDFALKVAKNYPIGFVPEVLLDVAKSEGSVSANHAEFYKNRCYIIKKNKKEILELGLLDEILTNLLQMAQRDGILPQIQKMVCLYLA